MVNETNHMEKFLDAVEMHDDSKNDQNEYNLNWNNKEAASYLNVLVSKYGKPSAVDSSRGGNAVWKKERLQNTVFERIELKDESVPHCTPHSHSDFVYAYIKYDVPASRFLDVSSISGGISYDPLKKELRSRGTNMEENLVALVLATQIGEQQLSFAYVQTNGLYNQWIEDAKNPANVDQLYDLLAFNLKHQKGNISSEGYWPLANPF